MLVNCDVALYRFVSHRGNNQEVFSLVEAIQKAIDALEIPVPVSMPPVARVEIQTQALNKHQVKVLNYMADNREEFETGISARYYQVITGVSKATATRHLCDLLDKECLEKMRGGGRSTRYRLILKS